VGIFVHEEQLSSTFHRQTDAELLNSRGLSYADWQDFITKFTAEFCLKNEVQMARTELETPQYFQGTRTVNEYINVFSEMIDHVCYFKGAHIILKLCQGLNPIIQDHVACLTNG
jgi:hypothetical protein